MNTNNDTCNEELGFAPQSFAELDFDSFLKEVTEEDLFQTQASVVPRLDTNLEDLSSVNITSLPSTLSYLPFDEESKLFDIPPLGPSLIADKPPQVHPVIKQEPVDTTKRTTRQSTSKVVKKQRTSKDTPAQQQVILQAPKKEEEEKYSKRLQANKKSAQASRERKKALKGELEAKLDSLTQENSLLQTQLIQMETENRVLKNEFAQLQNVINESSIISKLMARQVAATLPMKMGKLAPTNVAASSTKTPSSSPNVQAAAALYLMVVLHSFGQHLPSLPSLNNNITHIPNTVTVM